MPQELIVFSSSKVQEEPLPLVNDLVPVNGQQIYDPAASFSARHSAM